MTQWEYQWLPMAWEGEPGHMDWEIATKQGRFRGYGEILAALNKAGEAGWELVSSVPIVAGGEVINTHGIHLFFKRPRP